MKRTLKNLEPGQTVSIANCVGFFKVTKRIGQNLYAVNFRGREIEFQRNQLTVESGQG